MATSPGWRWPGRLPGWARSREWWPRAEAGTERAPAGWGGAGGQGRGTGRVLAPLRSQPGRDGASHPRSALPPWPRATVTSTPSPSPCEVPRESSDTRDISPRLAPLGNALQCWGLAVGPREDDERGAITALGTPSPSPGRAGTLQPHGRPAGGAPRWLQARGQRGSLMSHPRFPSPFARVGSGMEVRGGPGPPRPAGLPPGAAESEETGEPGLEPA